MRVMPLKTPLVKPGADLLQLIKEAVPKIPERSILAVTSKVVSLWENRVVDVPTEPGQKQSLIRKEVEKYLDPSSSKYNLMLTIRAGLLSMDAGIDHSNIEKGYVLLPEDSFASAAKIWRFLRSEYNLKEVGVVITDSMTQPLRWGVVGRSLGHCGFQALHNKIGAPDLYGRPLKMTQMSIVEGVAAAAVLEMGEANESTPLALVSEVRHAEFSQHPPTPEERAAMRIELEDDAYAPVLAAVEWKQGGI